MPDIYRERDPGSRPRGPAYLSGTSAGTSSAFGDLTAATVERYQEAVGEDTRAELGWYATGMGLGALLATAMAGIVHQPRDAWTLIGAGIGFWWSRRAWRRAAGR